jgi:hypothetical protein
LTRQRQLNDETAARLLSGRDRPSVLQKEALFEQLYRRVARREPAASRWPWRQLSLAGGAALCVAAALLLRPTAPEFTTRGGGPVNEPAFRVLCFGGGETSCRVGGALAFEVGAGAQSQYFAAFARRSDGAIIWYFPALDGLSTPLGSEPRSLMLDHGVELGAEQPPGHYEIFGIFSARPLSRAEIKAALGDDLRGSRALRVVRRGFEVLP